MMLYHLQAYSINNFTNFYIYPQHSVALKYVKNALAARALLQTLLVELTALPDSLDG